MFIAPSRAGLVLARIARSRVVARAHGRVFHGGRERARAADGVAAGAGQTATLKLLLAAGAEIDKPSLSGVTPLLRAVIDSRGPTVKALLAAGANPDLGDKKGVTPLIAAIAMSTSSIIVSLNALRTR